MERNPYEAPRTWNVMTGGRAMRWWEVAIAAAAIGFVVSASLPALKLGEQPPADAPRQHTTSADQL